MKNILKKLISAAAAAALVSGAVTVSAEFPDVSESDGAYRAVSLLSALGIVEGDENGYFNPRNKVTRAEFTKMAVKMLNLEDAAQSITAVDFEDANDHWAAGYIQLGVSCGFINGYDDTHFGPDDTVTYAQAVKMLVAAAGYTVYAENSGGWPAGYMTYGSTLGITNKISGAKNDTEVTRELAAVLIYNTLSVPIVEISYSGSNPAYSIMDGKNGRDYKTMLTEKHDAYTVLGRITETSRQSKALSKNQVKYQVEVSDNFDGKAYSKESEPFTMNIGSTNAADLLFYYTEAVVQKDVLNDEYTILTITAK
ncbi:MAG: S-layer homology domain-containing protein [Candidatus Ornithomonoglobus sp.]